MPLWLPYVKELKGCAEDSSLKNGFKRLFKHSFRNKLREVPATLYQISSLTHLSSLESTVSGLLIILSLRYASVKSRTCFQNFCCMCQCLLGRNISVQENCGQTYCKGLN